MTDEATLRAFAAGRIDEWHGLEAGDDLERLGAAGFAVDGSTTGRSTLGEEHHSRPWVAIESDTYEGGLRAWTGDGGGIVVMEGRHPIDGAGEPLAAPQMGEPAVTLDGYLGRVLIEGAEHVYPERGLAIEVNPDNGLLLAVTVFHPTSAAEYVAALRPPRLRPPGRLLVELEGGAS